VVANMGKFLKREFFEADPLKKEDVNFEF